MKKQVKRYRWLTDASGDVNAINQSFMGDKNRRAMAIKTSMHQPLYD